MSAIIAAWMPLSKLKEIVEILEDRNETGFKMTIGVNDESNDYHQNVSIWAEQSKEQKEEKTDRYFCGNGRVIWNNGHIENATKKDSSGTAFKTPTNEELEGKKGAATVKTKADSKKAEPKKEGNDDVPF